MQPQNGVDESVDAVGIAGLQSGNGKQNGGIPHGAWCAVSIKVGDGDRVGVGASHLGQSEGGCSLKTLLTKLTIWLGWVILLAMAKAMAASRMVTDCGLPS